MHAIAEPAPIADLRRRLADDAATARAGAALGAALRPGDAVMLSGGLGAGKTALARAAIRAMLAEAGREEEDIPSPTFTLAQVYQAEAEIWHVDLYRLSDPGEVWELGLDDAFAYAVVFVEWPERLGAGLPARRIEITLDASGDGRALTARFVGAGWDAARAALAAA